METVLPKWPHEIGDCAAEMIACIWRLCRRSDHMHLEIMPLPRWSHEFGDYAAEIIAWKREEK